MKDQVHIVKVTGASSIQGVNSLQSLSASLSSFGVLCSSREITLLCVLNIHRNCTIVT